MAYRRVLCLAFSRRDGGHCFAGIDLDTKKWVRPVPNSDGGALIYHDCLIRSANGPLNEPRVLDIIEIDLVAPAPKLAQPENWLVGRADWRLLGRGARVDLATYVSDDPELFRSYGKSVLASELKRRPPDCSLTLVSPQRLVWSSERDWYGKLRTVGTFSCCGQSYSLRLTDEAYEAQLGHIGQDMRVIHDDKVPILLTVSLGDIFEKTGSHYKLIAGVIL